MSEEKDLDELIESAHSVLALADDVYLRPILMCSFGKDSMVMLHLARTMMFDWPILFYREPFFPEKYEFANRVIQMWRLTVYDYPPAGTSLIEAKGLMEVMNYHSFGETFMAIPTGIIEPDYAPGKRFLCGKNDLLLKPLGTFKYPWDAVLLGHKSSDVDPLRGPMPLTLTVKQTPQSPDVLFPLRHWTDEDVWEYTEAYGIPIHESRYEKNGTWKERDDKTTNPDYFPTCMRCIDRNQPAVVICPLTGLELNNISSKCEYVDTTKPEVDYIGKV